MDYRIDVRPVAKRQLTRLPESVRIEVARLIDTLGADPRPRGVKPVVGRPGVLRARSGNYRILFTIDDRRRVVVIGRVAPLAASTRGWTDCVSTDAPAWISGSSVAPPRDLPERLRELLLQRAVDVSQRRGR